MPNPLRLIGLALLLAVAPGCASTNWNWFKPNAGGDSGKPGASPNVQGLVDYLNENARRVRTVKVDDLDIDANFDNQPINLRGRIYAEKPRNFGDARTVPYSHRGRVDGGLFPARNRVCETTVGLFSGEPAFGCAVRRVIVEFDAANLVWRRGRVGDLDDSARNPEALQDLTNSGYAAV